MPEGDESGGDQGFAVLCKLSKMIAGAKIADPLAEEIAHREPRHFGITRALAERIIEQQTKDQITRQSLVRPIGK